MAREPRIEGIGGGVVFVLERTRTSVLLTTAAMPISARKTTALHSARSIRFLV